MKPKKMRAPPAAQPCTAGETPAPRKWTTDAERRKLGKQLLAVYLSQGLPVEEAIEFTKLHPDLTSEKGRAPHHRTVVRWYRECTFAEEVAPDAPVDDLRAVLRKRVQASVNRWEAQRVAIAERLEVDQDFEMLSRINAEMIRCENQKTEYLKLLVRITHLDKQAPLERLDDGEIRQQLLQHVTASIRSFSVDELDEWIDRLSEAKERAAVVYEGEEAEVPTDDLDDVGIS